MARRPSLRSAYSVKLTPAGGRRRCQYASHGRRQSGIPSSAPLRSARRLVTGWWIHLVFGSGVSALCGAALPGAGAGSYRNTGEYGSSSSSSQTTPKTTTLSIGGRADPGSEFDGTHVRIVFPRSSSACRNSDAATSRRPGGSARHTGIVAHGRLHSVDSRRGQDDDDSGRHRTHAQLLELSRAAEMSLIDTVRAAAEALRRERFARRAVGELRRAAGEHRRLGGLPGRGGVLRGWRWRRLTNSGWSTSAARIPPNLRIIVRL